MSYVDGFFIAVPAANRQKFIDRAAPRVLEGWGDEAPDRETADFRRAANAQVVALEKSGGRS